MSVYGKRYQEESNVHPVFVVKFNDIQKHVPLLEHGNETFNDTQIRAKLNWQVLALGLSPTAWSQGSISVVDRCPDPVCLQCRCSQTWTSRSLRCSAFINSCSPFYTTNFSGRCRDIRSFLIIMLQENMNWHTLLSDIFHSTDFMMTYLMMYHITASWTTKQCPTWHNGIPRPYVFNFRV